MEFYNKNSTRSYPFIDNANMTAIINGAEFKVPLSVFVELRLNLTSPYPTGLVTLNALRFVGTSMLCDLTIGAVDTQLALDVAVPSPGSYWVSRGNDTNNGITWLVVFGDGLAEFEEVAGDALVTFTEPPTILPSLVRDMSQTRVASIADAEGHEISGDVLLEEGYNCSISINGQNVIISAKARQGAGFPCDETEAIGCSEVLYRVNGINAEHLVIGGAGIKVTPHLEDHTIDIEAVPDDEC